ncbi:MAG: carbohydrate binding domain-containing protein [Candidatus Methanoperedens sp.]
MNPGFESGTSPWIFYTDGTGKFTAGPPGYEGLKSANIVVYTGGTNIQLYQKGISLEPKTRYRLSFAAYSRTGHDLKVKLIKHVSPYTGYGLDQTFNLGASWQEFSTEFITTGLSGMVNDGRLMFYIAQFATAGDTYYIDNVLLEKVTETGTLSITKTPVSGDIYVDSVKKGTGSWSGLVSVGSHTVHSVRFLVI